MALQQAIGGSASLLETIGSTPLLDLSALLRRSPLPGVPDGAKRPSAEVRLLAKAEQFNPGGSVKDRPARAMVLAAEAQGLLGPSSSRRILDATSGNTGIALAMIAAARGYGITLCLPANASPERKRLLAAYGAEVVFTDPLEGSDGAIRKARELARDWPERYVYLDQYGNDENWRSHFHTTGPEIWAQTGGALTHFVTGLGTTGTFMGVGRFLRQEAPHVRLVSVQPDGPLHGLEGLKHMETALVPAIYDPTLADDERTVGTEDAYQMVKILARTLGICVGVSAGANVVAACHLASAIPSGVVVTMLCDGAEKYLSERFWEDP